MSTTLHAFKNYIVNDDMGNYEINYEDDEDYDIAMGNWHYIYTIMQYASSLIGEDINIPVYDWLDDADEVYENGMTLTDSNLFIKGLEAVLTNINKLNKCENPLIDGYEWRLYDYDKAKYDIFDIQKDKIISYTKMLLEWTKKGLHFVEEREQFTIQ